MPEIIGGAGTANINQDRRVSSLVHVKGRKGRKKWKLRKVKAPLDGRSWGKWEDPDVPSW